MSTETAELVSGIRIYRCGNVRTIMIDKTVSSDTFHTITALTDKPAYEIDFMCRHKTSDGKYYPAIGWITSAGVIKATYFSPGGTSVTSVSSGSVIGSVTYCV